MGLRAYILIKLKESVDPKKFRDILQSMDHLSEADFIDVVNGMFDIIMMVEAPVCVRTVVEKIQVIDGIDSVQTCQIIRPHKAW